MSTLDDIRIAQRNAGEAAVIANLERLGLAPKTTSPLELMTTQRNELLDQLKAMNRAYVNLLETGRDRILQYGGTCDSVEVMEAADPFLRESKAAITKAQGGAA
jgi:hypothetical protein